LIRNDQAGSFREDNWKVKEIINYIVSYAEKTDKLTDCNELRNELEEIASEWEFRTTGGLIYKNLNFYRKSTEKELLKNDISADKFRTMNSLRNVDPESGVYLLGG